MKYIPLKSYPEFEVNPFLEDAINEIEEKTVKKRIFIKGNKSVINHVINTDGQIVAHSAFIKTIEIDEAVFVKFYINKFSQFYDLTKSAKKVLGYILIKCIIPNKDIFYIDFQEAREITGYSSDNIIRSGLSSLVEHSIIARSTNSYKYFINPLVLFNGDRVSFALSYVKKRKNLSESDKNQLSIW